jgi:hypothetical protein
MVQFGLESEFEDGRGGRERGRPLFVHGNLLKRIAGYVQALLWYPRDSYLN